MEVEVEVRKTKVDINPRGIRNEMIGWKHDAGLKPDEKVVFFAYAVEKGTDSVEVILEVFTRYPGRLIGKQGFLYNNYSENLKEHCGVDRVAVKEIKESNYV